MDWLDIWMIGKSTITFLFQFIFRTSIHDFFFFFRFISCIFWQQSIFWCLFLWQNIAVNFLIGVLVFKFGGCPTFFTLRYFLPSSNVFLYYKLGTMCNNSSLGVWKETLSVIIFFFCLFVSITFQKKKKTKIMLCCCKVWVKLQLWFAFNWLS